MWLAAAIGSVAREGCSAAASQCGAAIGGGVVLYGAPYGAGDVMLENAPAL